MTTTEIESNFAFGGRTSNNIVDKSGDLTNNSIGNEELQLLGQSLDSFGKFKVANQSIADHRSLEQIEEKKLTNTLGHSQVALRMIKGLMQDEFSAEDLVRVHELHLGSLPKIGISINGKDLTLIDKPTLLHSLWLAHIEQLVSFGIVFTREKLIALLYLIMHHMWNRDPTSSLHYMKLFNNEYRKTKRLYTTIMGNSLDSSWERVLGKVYTENEFDIFNDLETDLPVNLKSIHTVFSSFVSFAESERVPVDVYLKTLDEEHQKNPLNPYIPYMKVMMEDEFEEIDTVLRILDKSSYHPMRNSRNYERMEEDGIFSNKKPQHVEPIKDFKFLPVLYWKAYSISNQDLTADISKWLENLEIYSRMPSHCKLLNLKMINEYSKGNYQTTLSIFNFIEKHYHQQVKFDEDYSQTYYGCNALAKLGRKNECLPIIQKKINRYAFQQVPGSSFKELLSQFQSNQM